MCRPIFWLDPGAPGRVYVYLSSKEAVGAAGEFSRYGILDEGELPGLGDDRISGIAVTLLFRSEALKAVSPVKLAHVVLRTKDNFDAMLSLYRTVLNARVVFGGDGMAFLTYDDEHHRIAIGRLPDLKAREGRYVGLDHVAFTYRDGEHLLNTYARLNGVGLLPFGAVNHGPTTSLYYLDPDRNRVELQIDNFANMDDATQLMRDTFAIDPIGVEFDPRCASPHSS